LWWAPPWPLGLTWSSLIAAGEPKLLIGCEGLGHTPNPPFRSQYEAQQQAVFEARQVTGGHELAGVRSISDPE
jgi:hypothetical protein